MHHIQADCVLGARTYMNKCAVWFILHFGETYEHEDGLSHYNSASSTLRISVVKNLIISMNASTTMAVEE
jgi:hypothetical protein